MIWVAVSEARGKRDGRHRRGRGSRQSAPAGHQSGARNVGLVLIANIMVPLAGLGITPVLTRTLGVAGRGEVAAATAVLLLATSLGTLGLPQAVTFFVAKRPELMRMAISRGLWFIAGCGALGTVICVLASSILAGDDRVIRKLIVVAVLATIPTLAGLVLRASAAGLGLWRLVAIEQAVTGLLRVVSVCALALFQALTPLSATIALSAAPLVGSMAYLGLSGRSSESGIAPSGFAAGAFLRYGGRVWLGSIAVVLLNRLDQVLLTPLSSAYQLGLYSVAVNMYDVAFVVGSAIRDVSFASDSARHDDDRLVAAARISGFVSLCFCLVLAACVPFGISLIWGADFSGAAPAALILLLSVALLAPGAVAGAGLDSRGHPQLHSFSLVISALVNVTVVFLLVPTMGALGAALANLIGGAVLSQLDIWLLCRRTSMRVRDFYGLRRSDVAILQRRAAQVLRVNS